MTDYAKATLATMNQSPAESIQRRPYLIQSHCHCAACSAGTHAWKVQIHGEARQAAYGTCEVYYPHVCDACGR